MNPELHFSHHSILNDKKMNKSATDNSGRDEAIYHACRNGLLAKLKSILYTAKTSPVNRLLKPMDSRVEQ